MPKKNDNSKQKNRKNHRRGSIIVLISFAAVMTVLTIASDFLDLILIYFGWHGLAIAVVITFLFFVFIYKYGLKGHL